METKTPISIPLTRLRAKREAGVFALNSKKKIIRLPTLALTILFVGLRLMTSNINHPFNTSPILPILGVLIIILLVKSNPTWGFVFVLYDMCLLAEQVGVESWQFYSIFRFRDMEFLVLMALAMEMGGFSFKAKHFASITQPIKLYLVLVGMAIIISAISYNLRDALQVSRTLVFIALVFAMPAFCKDQDDLKRLLKYVFFFISISTLIDFAGFVIGNPQIMTPFNYNLNSAGIIWAGLGGVSRTYSGIGYAGYQVPFNFLAIFVLVAFMVVQKRIPFVLASITGIAIILEILSISKSSLGGLVLGFGIIIPLGLRRAKLIIPFLLATISVIIFLFIFAQPLANLEVTNSYINRFTQLFEQISGNQEGTFTSRLAYFNTATQVMELRGGNVLTGMGYQLLPTEYGVMFNIVPFNQQAFQESGQLIGTTSLDSGWGNVFWTLGLVGVIFFLWFTIYYLKLSFTIYKNQPDIVSRCLSLALFAFLIIFPILFFGMTLIYGKQQIFFTFQIVLIIGTLGLWQDYSNHNNSTVNKLPELSS